VTARDVNAFLREIAGAKISLKDFRTLLASASVLEALARYQTRSKRARARRRQVLEAISAAAEDLANTPAICRKSYVHETVVIAFERGILRRLSRKLKNSPSPTRLAKALAQIVAGQRVERSRLRANRAERRQSTR
jgi:DNA topoisomerase-1